MKHIADNNFWTQKPCSKKGFNKFKKFFMAISWELICIC